MAPFSMRILHTFRCPLRAAACSGVTPLCASQTPNKQSVSQAVRQSGSQSEPNKQSGESARIAPR
eukprot:123455-Prorocentrum_minimum.AAC.1